MSEVEDDNRFLIEVPEQTWTITDENGEPLCFHFKEQETVFGCFMLFTDEDQVDQYLAKLPNDGIPRSGSIDSLPELISTLKSLKKGFNYVAVDHVFGQKFIKTKPTVAEFLGICQKHLPEDGV